MKVSGAISVNLRSDLKAKMQSSKEKRELRVTVCVPTYFGAEYIESCLVSIASQENVSLQIVVCDDQSSDGTLEIVRRVASRYPNVDWVIKSNLVRLGMVENWNACVALADGEFVKMMGQDDLLWAGCLWEQAAVLAASPSVSIVAVRRAIINSRGMTVLNVPAPFKPGLTSGRAAAIRCMLSGTNTVGDPVALLLRTSLLREAGPFDVKIRYCTDVAMIMRMLGLGDLFFDSTPRVGYRIHRNAVGKASQQIVVSDFLRCLAISEETFGLQFTKETRGLVALKSKVLSLIRVRLYDVFNQWPFMRPTKEGEGAGGHR